MNIFKWLKKRINNFFNSIDTITTKLLTLVLCCITIPLIVVGTFSTDIINQSIIDNSQASLEINKKIFEKKYQDELDGFGKRITENIKTFQETNHKISDLQSETLMNYLFKYNDKLTFGIILDANQNIKTSKGTTNPDIIKEKFSKTVKNILANTPVLSTEKVENDLFQVAFFPVFKNNSVYSVVILGKSLKNSEILPYVSSITNAAIAVYAQSNETTEIIAASGLETGSNKLLKVGAINDLNNTGFYSDGSNLTNLDNFSINFPLTNFDKEPVAKVYLGIPKFDFIFWVNKNVQFMSFISIISLLVAIVIAALFARKITDPILELKEAAESINLGDLNYKVDIKGNDETVKLAKAFNRMVSNLERDERLRNNFVATLTHDLKVPMLAENQTITFLLKEAYGSITDEQREVLELMKSTNSSSLEMIGTLLEVYRYDCGNVRLYVTEFNLFELLKESVNQIKSLAEEKRINININTSHENIEIKADKRDIKRLIHNIVSNSINHGIHRGFINCNLEVIKNAFKYVPKSDTEYYTSLIEPVEISNSVLISVEDNGVGISREDMPLLFNRFSLSKGRKPAGSGLGLYYASQVIKTHNGVIWAESSETGGSTLKFTLPLND
ncbi:MAG TPA: HAMP domain-containing sensor histidine kinase [Candidatus Gastranaerophilales bacterium]|nr:HAMP domain-containing sensor histidine kinase [Candidatus Gastranaerophilales bacterium]